MKQEININDFIKAMEHPNNEQIKKEVELALKSKNIPDEIKNQIKSKFYDIEDKKELGEEYDRYLVNLLNKKRKDFKYLQAIFLIINNIEKNEILKKEGIIPEVKYYSETKEELPSDEGWYIDIQIDLVFNDNNYYYKYIKKIILEFYELMDKEFLNNYIKQDFIKKGESYYRNHQEEFLSNIIILFDKLNTLTKIINKNEQKRKKKNKKKKNKNKVLISNNNSNNNEDNDNDNDDNSEIKESDNNIKNENNNEKNINNNINNNIEQKIENNNKLDNQNKGELLKNKIWLNNLKLNSEQLEFTNNIFDKSLKNEDSYINKTKSPDKSPDILSENKIEQKLLDLERQISELKSKNKAQENQISQCQEDILKLQKENDNLKKEVNNTKLVTNIFISKKISNLVLKKIINKYKDKLKLRNEEGNTKLYFVDDINNIKVNDLNKFMEIILNNINLNNPLEIKDNKEKEKNNLFNIFLNTIENNNTNNIKLYENIIESLLSKEEIKDLNNFEEDNEIKRLINEIK